MRDWQLGEKMVLGIDPSLTSTGLALLDFVTGSVIATKSMGSSKLRGGARLNSNLQKFQEFMAPSLRKIVIIVMEDYAYAGQGQQRLQMAEWVGVIKLELNRATQIDPCLVSPSTLKKFITGNGQAPDKVIALEAYKRFAWEFPTPDEVDACGLAEFGRRLELIRMGKDWEENLIEKQKEALLTIAKKEGLDVKRSEKRRAPRRSGERLQIRLGDVLRRNRESGQL